jgi:hypothetical protein
MATFKEINSNDIKVQRSSLSQIIDVIQEDVSGSTSRKKYQVFVTGGLGPGVTSSLFQTVYDQDFTYQTANPIFDITVGLYPNGSTVSSSKLSEDAAGKPLFPSSSLMMREKMSIYQQFAQTLLGDKDLQFASPFDSTNANEKIDCALFICMKRLFSRDQIKRETLALQFYQTASTTAAQSNLGAPTTLGATVYTDVGSSTNKITTYGGQVGNIVNSSNTANYGGLVFYDRGIIVLDLNRITSGSQFMTGTVDAVNSTGQMVIGRAGSGNANAAFIPDFVVSGSIDNILDHICGVRFSSGSITAMTFQNVTNINSTLVFCRASADEFNYSSNPTFIDSNNRIVVIDEGQEDTQQSFTMVTTVGLYDANDNLLAVGKLSRPVEKNPEKDLSLRLRIDY